MLFLVRGYRLIQLFTLKSLLKNGLQFNTQYRLAADFDFMYQCFLLQGVKVRYVSDILVSMRLGGATNNKLKNIIHQT